MEIEATFSRSTLNLLAVLLSQIHLDPNAEDLVEQAEIVSLARSELLKALEKINGSVIREQ